jgi:hypothetical protein
MNNFTALMSRHRSGLSRQAPPGDCRPALAGPGPGREGHSDTTLNISLVIICTKYTVRGIRMTLTSTHRLALARDYMDFTMTGPARHGR